MNKKILVIIILVIVIVLFVGLLYNNRNESSDSEEVAEDNTQSEENQVLEESSGVTVEEQEEEKQGTESEIEVGKEAPEITLLDLNGEEVLLSDYRGNYVIINFWGTWCQWCDLEMPDLQRIHDENEDVVVLAVNVMEETADVEEYIEEGGYSFPVVLDGDGQVSLTYLVTGYPTSYFIDKDGIFLGRVASYMDYEQMNGVLDEIME